MSLGDWPGWAALALAIISPFITTLLNNRHSIRMKKYDLFIARKMDALQNYLSCTAQYLNYRDVENKSAYGAALGNVYPFLTPELCVSVNELASLLQHELESAPLERFHQLAPQIAALFPIKK